MKTNMLHALGHSVEVAQQGWQQSFWTLKRVTFLFVLATFTAVSAAELPSTTECRDEWHAAKDNSHSFISAQWHQVEGDKKHDVQHGLNTLFWRLELCKQLAASPEGEQKRWGIEFLQLMGMAVTSVTIGDAMVQKTPYPLPFYYVTSCEELPILHALAQKMATEFKVQKPLVAVADHIRMGTAWVVAGTGASSLLVVGSGLLDRVDDQGLEGVLAHEFAHIERNHPIQKGMLPLLITMLLFFLFGFFLWRFGLYLGLAENTIQGFGLLVLFALACEVGGLIPKIAALVQPLHSRYIERDADRRACEVHAPATAQLHRAFIAMKKEFDDAIAVRDMGYNNARDMIEKDENLADHIKKTLRTYIDGLEKKARVETATRHSQHPPFADRIAVLEKQL